MTTTTDAELHPCLCGCGTMVPGKWARGHWARGQKGTRDLRPLPGPDDELPDDDSAEDLPPELVAELDQLDWLDSQQETEPDSGPAPDDPPPARLRQRRSTPAPARRARANATVQKDVHAKVRMILMPAAKMWEIRDNVCGSVAVEQEPAVSEAFTEIICDSPDLLNFFTGPGGSYMKYFKLAMALWPVGMVVVSHHIAHGEQGGERPSSQQPAFAA